MTSGKVRNGTLLKKDFKCSELPAGPAGAPGATGIARAYGAFTATGTLNPVEGTAPVGGSALGLSQEEVTPHVAGTGEYCLHPTVAPKSAMVSAMGDLAFATSSFIVATVSVRTAGGLSGCAATDTIRVRTYRIPNAAAYAPPVLADQPFIVWLE